MSAVKKTDKNTDNRFSDAALLKGKYAFHADQLRESTKATSGVVDWSKAACDNLAEEAAQEIAKHIFAFNEALDSKKEQLEIIALTAVGQMKVLGIAPGDGDLLRVDGVLMPDEIPTSHIVHANQLALTFVRVPIEEPLVEDENESNRIGFVIFGDLKDRQKARYKKKKRAARKFGRKAAKKSTKTPTMDELMAVALKAKKEKKRAVKKSKAKKTTKKVKAK